MAFRTTESAGSARFFRMAWRMVLIVGCVGWVLIVLAQPQPGTKQPTFKLTDYPVLSFITSTCALLSMLYWLYLGLSHGLRSFFRWFGR